MNRMRAIHVALRAAALAVLATTMSAGAACGGRKEDATAVKRDAGPPLDASMQGTFEIEYLQYNDVNDVYRVFLVGRPNANEPKRFNDVRLARIPPEQKKKPFLQDDGSGPVVWLPDGFHIGFLHGVVEKREDDGKKINVVVRTERRFWFPFQTPSNVDPSTFNTPTYFYPPPVPPTGPVIGYGGVGATKEQALESYRLTNGAVPESLRLKNEGYLTRADIAALPDAGLGVIPRVKPDPRTARDNKVLHTVPGTPAAREELLRRQKQPPVINKPLVEQPQRKKHTP
jgi:hypothetical protein